MPNYRSLVPGGFFQNPDTSTRHVSIRTNNPGAINGASWEKDWPGYVKDVKYDGKNNTTIFETPEQGIAVWYELMRKYRSSGAVTIKDIVWKYGGGQANYTSYGKMVAQWMGVPDSTTINLEDDKSLLPFAKAMFRYEAGEPPPWSDEQILYGFMLARMKDVVADVKRTVPAAAPASPTQSQGWLAGLVAALGALFSRKADAATPSVPSPVLPPQADPSIPPWLATMRKITGTLETPGSSDNPTILAWRDEIARRFPDMAAYCANYTHDSIPWCGLTVAYVMAANGIRPVFGRTDTDKFLWADAWKNFGTRLDKPKLGCVMVFTRNGGGHVSLYEGEDATTYIIRGGNQADAVNVEHISKNKFTAAVWPA